MIFGPKSCATSMLLIIFIDTGISIINSFIFTTIRTNNSDTNQFIRYFKTTTVLVMDQTRIQSEIKRNVTWLLAHYRRNYLIFLEIGVQTRAKKVIPKDVTLTLRTDMYTGTITQWAGTQNPRAEFANIQVTWTFSLFISN